MCIPVVSSQGALWGTACVHLGWAAYFPRNPWTSSKKPWGNRGTYFYGVQDCPVFSKLGLCRPQKYQSCFRVTETEGTRAVFGATLSLPITLYLHTLLQFLSGGVGEPLSPLTVDLRGTAGPFAAHGMSELNANPCKGPGGFATGQDQPLCWYNFPSSAIYTPAPTLLSYLDSLSQLVNRHFSKQIRSEESNDKDAGPDVRQVQGQHQGWWPEYLPSTPHTTTCASCVQQLSLVFVGGSLMISQWPLLIWDKFNYMGRKRKPSNDHMDRKTIRLFCVGQSN